MQSVIPIQFNHLYPGLRLPNRRCLKDFLYQQLLAHHLAVEQVSYIFCTDDYLLALNLQYLNHNTLTDIITFELSPARQPLVAEVYLSIDRVKENAGKFGVPFQNELHRVIFHGALHLSGYKDKSPIQLEQMRAKEEELLRAYFVPRDTVSS